MKRFAYSFIGLVFAATAAHAQPVTGAAQGNVSVAVQGPQIPGATLPARALPALPADTDAELGAEVAADASVDAADSAIAATSATPAAAGTAAAISDADIDSFAKATVELQLIQNDASIAAEQKQTAMAAVVAEAGLDPAKYNEIGAKVSTDAELRARIQTAMARHAKPSDG